jgi:hypothetical protein
VFEPSLRAGVPVEQRAVVRPLGHLALEPAQLRLERDEVAAPRQDVVAQRQVALARRALVVEGHPRALLEGQLAAVDAGFARHHPEEGGLAGAVAPGEGHPVAALELERHAAEQGRPCHVLVQRACDHDGHVSDQG